MQNLYSFLFYASQYLHRQTRLYKSVTLQETPPAVLNQSGLSGFGLPSYYASSTNKVGLFVLRSDGAIDVELLYLISETNQTAAANRDKLDVVLIDESTSGVMVVTTFVLSALRLIGYAMRHL